MSNLMERRFGYVETLLASSAKVATGNSQSSPVYIKDPESCIAFVLDLTVAATLVGDTADIFVQTYLGGVWVDVCHFTQVLGNGGAKRIVGKISTTATEAMFENAASLAAGSVRHLIGDAWAVRWAIAGTGSFTFSLTATPG